jgi:hypothetical protein
MFTGGARLSVGRWNVSSSFGVNRTRARIAGDRSGFISVAKAASILFDQMPASLNPGPSPVNQGPQNQGLHRLP